MYILGLNVYHGDSSACLLKNGEILCAFEEERFTRKKHWAGFPLESIKSCLKENNLTINNVDFITISRNPKHNFYKKLIYLFLRPSILFNFKNRFKNRILVKDLAYDFEKNFSITNSEVQKKIQFIEHHSSHLASAFFASPFIESAILSVDAFGDFSSTVIAYGKGNKINNIAEVNFPHSIGQFYTAFTQYLGFHQYGDEYKESICYDINSDKG